MSSQGKDIQAPDSGGSDPVADFSLTELIDEIYNELTPEIEPGEMTVGMLLKPGITRNMLDPILKRKLESGAITRRRVIHEGKAMWAYRKA